MVAQVLALYRRLNKSERSSPEFMETEQYDFVILGGGTGSTIAAWTFAAEGQRVGVIERKYIGGSCPNIACLPSKNILHSARVASYPKTLELTLSDGTTRQLRGSKVIVSTGRGLH